MLKQTKNNFFILMFCFVFVFLGNAEAKLIQILHINDTHSFLDNATHDDKIGGVARLKSLIDSYKYKMKSNGVETITLDAGDFLEGNLFFLADQGQKTLLAQNELGLDAVTMGNHDYLMGGADFLKLFSSMDLNFTFLAANVSVGSQCDHMKNILRPYKEINIGGIKIGILGITSDELMYKWRFECGEINNAIKSALYYGNELHARENDLVIGLTHIGLEEDIKLVKKSTNLDLIIGGHSHSELHDPLYIKNKDEKFIPILQAGYHTKYLGRMLVDIIKNQPMKVISYELIPVSTSDLDQKMLEIVSEANQLLYKMYGEGYLEKNIGYSDLKKDDPIGDKKWAYYIADTIKEKMNADLSIHSYEMNGEAYPVGNITRRDLMNSIPRVFDINDLEGWSIYTTKIKGAWLELMIKLLEHSYGPLVYSGITWKYIHTPFGLKVGPILVNGKMLNPFKSYNVALTEGVVKGAVGINPLTTSILQHSKKSNFRIWSALEERLQNSRRITYLRDEPSNEIIINL